MRELRRVGRRWEFGSSRGGATCTFWECGSSGGVPGSADALRHPHPVARERLPGSLAGCGAAIAASLGRSARRARRHRYWRLGTGLRVRLRRCSPCGAPQRKERGRPTCARACWLARVAAAGAPSVAFRAPRLRPDRAALGVACRVWAGGRCAAPGRVDAATGGGDRCLDAGSAAADPGRLGVRGRARSSRQRCARPRRRRSG
jgi:hypothetical protein